MTTALRAIAILVTALVVRTMLSIAYGATPAPPEPRPGPPPRPAPLVREASNAFAPALARVPTPLTHAPPRTIPRATLLVQRARIEVDLGVRYDASYRRVSSFPWGDVPADVGACTDLVIRAFRAVDIDLQRLVYEDVTLNPYEYPVGPIGDANIDHRRVATLYYYFRRHGIALPTQLAASSDFHGGDVLFFTRKHCPPSSRAACLPGHVALVSDRTGPRGMPLVLQNGGPMATESDSLDQPTMVGHYRLTAP